MKNKDFQQLSIILTEYDKVWAYCIYHKDINRPNLSISLLDKYYGKWRCWACGKGGRLTKKQMGELNLSESTVYKNDKSINTRWQMFNKSCYDNLQRFPLLKLGLAKQLNISTKSLDDWLVGFDGVSFTVPMFREDLSEYHREGGLCGIQRRFSDGTKRCITGSHLGLMYPQDLISGYYVFICEGFSDAVSVWDLGFQSIARPHCRYTDGIEEFLGIEGATEHIIIIPDNDTVGIAGANKLLHTLDNIYYGYDDDAFPCECSIFSFDGAKDIRQLIQLKGEDYVKGELERYV